MPLWPTTNKRDRAMLENELSMQGW